MAKYTNIGTVPLTVRGVTIKPGETKDLKGFANDRNLVRFNEPRPAGKKGKKKNADKPVATSSVVEVKNDPTPASQNDSKKDDKQNVKADGQ